MLTDQALYAVLGSRPFRFQHSVESTNDIAREWALGYAPSGAIVIAEEQTRGRGRFNRTWVAPASGALMFTMILKVPLSTESLTRALPRVTMLGSVAVAEVIEAELADADSKVGIKWPNDVQIDGRKVCGVLPELIWNGDTLAAVILGIGINTAIDFSGSDLEGKATSIQSVTGRLADRLMLLKNLLSRLGYWTGQLQDPGLFAAWRDRIRTIGLVVTATRMGEDSGVTGIATGVDENGRLIIQDGDGVQHSVNAGEVTLHSK